MYEEDSCERIRCPYCASESCSHLLAIVDLSFHEWCAGYVSDDERHYEFHRVIEDAFRQLFQSGVRESPVSQAGLAELWKYALQDHSREQKTPLKGEDEEISLDPDILDALIIELFENAGAVDQSGIDDFGGAPGYSSSMAILYAENPQVVFDAALANLKKLLRLAPIRTGK